MCKWQIPSANINFEAKILLNLPLYVLKNLCKHFNAIYRQNFNLLFQPSIDYFTSEYPSKNILSKSKVMDLRRKLINKRVEALKNQSRQFGSQSWINGQKELFENG